MNRLRFETSSNTSRHPFRTVAATRILALTCNPTRMKVDLIWAASSRMVRDRYVLRADDNRSECRCCAQRIIKTHTATDNERAAAAIDAAVRYCTESWLHRPRYAASTATSVTPSIFTMRC